MVEYLAWDKPEYQDLVLRGCEVNTELSAQLLDRLSRTKNLSRVFHPPKGWVENLMDNEDPVTLGIIDNMVSAPINSAKVSVFGDSALTLDRKIGKKWEKSDAKSQLEEIAIPGVQREVFSVQRGRPMAKLRETI